MKKIRYLTIRFDTEILPDELPAFRGAIIEKVGREHDIFHNHDTQTGFLYRYPQIQYKCLGRTPAILCLEAGVDEIHHLFQSRTWDITLNGRPVTLAVRDLRMNQFTMQAWEHSFLFSIRNWLALNQENYERFTALARESDQLAFLERILRGNILSMAKGLDWFIDREVKVYIRALAPLRMQRFKGQLLASFEAEFETNVFLPDLIGLGKGASMGHGVVRPVRQRRTERKPFHQNTIKPGLSPEHDDEY